MSITTAGSSTLSLTGFIFPTDRNLGSFTRLRKVRTWISPLRVFTGGPGAARPSEFHQSQKGGLWNQRLMLLAFLRCAPRCSFQLR